VPKLTNNILSAVALAATVEAFVTGVKGGLDPEVMLTAINAGSGRNKRHGEQIPRRGANPQLRLRHRNAHPDEGYRSRHCAGRGARCADVVCEAARLVFKHAMHKGAAKEDLTAIVKYVERDAGFEIPKTR
jgi:3-hydroxyisobutyrate dehydrogenase-like beta-hydroxyacid dehydrogenase